MINEVHTICKNCGFSQWDGNTQIGCSKNRLEILKAAGVEILQAYDDDKEFDIVNGKYCIYSRSNSWIEKHKDNIDGQLEKELQFKYNAIINFNNESIFELEKTVKSLNNQERLPARITVVRPSSSKTMPSTIAKLFTHSLTPWRIQNLIENENFLSGVDMVVKSLQIPYYSLFNSGFELTDTAFFKKLEVMSNDHNLQFVYLNGDANNNGTTVQKIFHDLYLGNKTITLEEKILEDKIECQNIYQLLQ
jgi:hypothetical protein